MTATFNCIAKLVHYKHSIVCMSYILSVSHCRDETCTSIWKSKPIFYGKEGEVGGGELSSRHWKRTRTTTILGSNLSYQLSQFPYPT